MRDPDPNPNIPPNPYTRRWTAERPETVEGQYEPPPTTMRRASGPAKAAGGVAVALALLLAKFKGLLLLLLNLKWLFYAKYFLTFGLTFLLSLWVYALFFGWKFGLIFLVMLAAHEFGHFVAFRNYGLQVKLPTFIPLLGAFTAGSMPRNAEQSAYIALAGPLTGLGASAICYAFGIYTHEKLWLAAAYLGAFINLFNMVPVPPFDGGGIAAVFSPRIWIYGFGAFIVAALLLHMPLLFVLLLGLIGLPRALAGFKGHYDAAYYAVPPLQRTAVGLWYLGTAFGLVYLMTISRVSVS
ncbi:MAG: site-2 protease family protein [Candidatus Eremiobacteraeota bacterium]|nr:site-2 protease family protein [Candidatus Eremiobacteraeota bacterium]